MRMRLRFSFLFGFDGTLRFFMMWALGMAWLWLWAWHRVAKALWVLNACFGVWNSFVGVVRSFLVWGRERERREERGENRGGREVMNMYMNTQK